MVRPLATTIIAIVCALTGALMGCAEQVPESPLDAAMRDEIRSAETIELLSLDPMTIALPPAPVALPKRSSCSRTAQRHLADIFKPLAA